MVKIVASDMDGTLLDSQKNFPKEMDYVLRKLNEKNVKFIVASGRQYYNLAEIFKRFDQDLIYISENGSMVLDNDKMIYFDEIDKEKLFKPIEIARKIKGTSIVLSGEKGAYTENTGEFFQKNVAMYYDRIEVLDDVLDVVKEGRDRICKIALFHDENSEKYLSHEFGEVEDDFLICVSSEFWMDFMNPGVNKGEAIKKIQEYYDITYDETMAFGDYLNDYEMLQSCKYSYAMENAHPKLKEISNYHAKSNDENGVMEVIKSYFKI
ncbi:MAG: HAD family hydrolase [Intestinibacter sp.]|uniref:HAD family hydrolase n=1 Tax=Intestinibacter sp. TaxID=1965304 RepID=UPI003F18CA18